MWPFRRKDVKSTHKVEVVRVKLEKHPNADSLSLVRVWGYQLVVRTEDWKDGDLAAYIQPDSMVPASDSQFAFLAASHKEREGKYRITAIKLRKERSEGLLVKAPKGAKEGDNVATKFGVTRYISPAERRELALEEGKRGLLSRINSRGRRGLSFAGNERGPSIWIPVYDLENFYRYPDMFSPDDPVSITEKVHGCNARFVYSSADRRMYAGSRTTWKRPYYVIPRRGLGGFARDFAATHLGIGFINKKEATDDWNRILRSDAQDEFSIIGDNIKHWCQDHPDHVLFGEIYGWIQDLRYGHSEGDISFVGFDVFYKGTWWPWAKVRESFREYGIPHVPILYEGLWGVVGDERGWFPATKPIYVEGKTRLGSDRNQMREGCVVRMLLDEPIYERHGYPGRKILKAVSSAYLERAEKDANYQPNVGG